MAYRIFWPVVLVAALAAAQAVAWETDDHDFPLASRQTQIGLVWTTDEGMTLYTYSRDRASASTCTGDCARRFPPHVAESRHRQFPPEGFSVITRSDGRLQWAYENRPLYLFSEDNEPGNIHGHGYEDRWWVAQPRAGYGQDDP
ncbi:hypothetical protein E4656_01990 [Natronospirillum operosum]|uniref:Lipoprotein n=1 Tax=Natronospirillum operosum TaxID=2759953 RepID=A0A4Z0WJ66_9GAMM|nr:hypothetical protein [Natronospirillum operosum]TGG95215.1 hypothetical protein E4656_01990 [Natronospirillum operosum]